MADRSYRTLLNLPNGRRFVIETEHLSDGNRYIGAVTLNGKPRTPSRIRHEEIMAGGTLRLRMQGKPNREWATSHEDRPLSMSAYRSSSGQ